jgi:xanthine dehydrogenase YagR molybdenum-binding subunit
MEQDEKNPKGLSRRGFLKGAGVATASATVLLTAEEAEATKAKVSGPGALSITLNVNGADKRVQVEPRTTLAQALRDKLGLTGTKVGCDRGACSACTVMLDGTPVVSCLTLAVDVGRRKVTTVEGLARGEQLHPVQKAFVEKDATQCGFCTPGMVMSCAALLQRNPNPSASDVKEAVCGNLCRCGTYPKVFEATLAAAQATQGIGGSAAPQAPAMATAETATVPPEPLPRGKLKVGIVSEGLKEVERPVPESEPPQWPPNAELSVVGKPTQRLDGPLKVTGKARYTSDVQLAGMLHAKRLVSPHAHARIKSVDTSEAEKIPGVRAVHVMERAYGNAQLRDPKQESESKYPMLRYVGQTIAGVAATSQETASEAVKRIKVEYEVLPHVVDLDDAMKPDAPRVYPGAVDMGGTAGGGGAMAGLPQKGNVRGPAPSPAGPRGDVKKGFAEAEVIVEGEFRTQVQTHSALEPHGVVADWRPDALVVYASTQGVLSVRDELAEVFGLPRSKVRVITEFMGGGFGAKFGAGHYGLLATWLSKKAGAPVKLMLDRREEHTSVGNRPSSLQKLRIGAKKDGTLTAIQLSSWGTAGVATGAGVGSAAENMYPAPHLSGERYDVFTHAGPGAAFRAPGMPQAMFAMEQMIDELAEKLTVDPLVLRDKLDVDGARFVHDSEARRVERRVGAERIGWSQRKRPGSDTGPIKRGIGVAQSMMPRVISLEATAEVRIGKDGSVEVLSATQDIGTGTRTVIAQVVAEELGLRPRDIEVKIGDTQHPPGPPSGGSQVTGSITPAARAAAYQAKLKLFAQVAQRLEAKPEELVAHGGKVFARSRPEKALTWKKAAARIKGTQVSAQASRAEDYTGSEMAFGRMRMGIGALGGVQFAQVAVDTETGVIQVERIVAVHDCGRPINPLAVESQLNGGIIQGLSYGLFEDRLLDRRSGRMLNPNLEQYKIAGAKEIPEIEIVLLEQLLGYSSTDAAGSGESGNIATAAAIANAVYNAIGVRLKELPMTPAQVLEALSRRG